MMNNESEFLTGLLGKRVRITAVDEGCLPPLLLREVSGIGVVAADERTAHFFPWHEIIEIHPADDGMTANLACHEGLFVDSLLGLDSEP